MVDDDRDFRVAVTRLLQASGYEVCAYDSAHEFLKAERSSVPGCVLLDVSMPDMSGLDLQQELARHEEQLPIIFLTGHGDIPMSVRAIQAGAIDFLTKPVEREPLLEAIERALVQDALARATREQTRALRTRYGALTPRERQVFDEVTAGKSSKQIAVELGTAERTIKAHRANLMEKMQVSSVAELARAAEQLRAVEVRLHHSQSH
jgi:FixJ family two-component response regulator